MNLAWLLLGPGKLQRSRGYLAALGLILLGVGACIVVDASDGVTQLALETFGWVLALLGLLKLALSLLSGQGGTPGVFGFQGLVYVVLGIAITQFPSQSGTAIPGLFGIAFLLNGGYQAASALVIRYPLWGWYLASGIAHIVFGGLMFLEWKMAIHWVVPLFLGGGLVFLGASTLRTALHMGRYARGMADPEAWDTATAVRYYLEVHMPRRFRRPELNRHLDELMAAGAPDAPSQSPARTGAEELMVHIWTPTTVAHTQDNTLLISRYVVARDQEGKFTVGHAALELAPDLYISHCDGDPTAFDNGDEVWRELRSRDVSGVFLPSFQEEIEHYLQPSVTVRFRNFRPAQIRTFWEVYRRTTAYNLTNRNCSVAVALALEAALMGSMGGRQRLRALLSLLLSKDLWVAQFIRWKAREMVWTPGMMLDYALALQRVVEP